MILVYQMAKVASRSWVDAISASGPDVEPPIHIHHLSPAFRARLAEVIALPAPHQTIVNRIMPREQLRKGVTVLQRVEDCRRSGEPIKIITGFRDPVARSISMFMFMADFYEHNSRVLSARRGATVDSLAEALLESWRSVFDAKAPETSFEWLCREYLAFFRDWFADELQTVFGLDVLSAPYPEGGVQRLVGEGVEALVYRVEDLAPEAQSHSALLSAAADFLERPALSLPLVNTAATRRSAGVSQGLAKAFHLPGALIDAIYGAATVRHFYSPSEIAAFKARWRRPDQSGA